MKHIEKYYIVKQAAGLAVNAGRTALQAFNASKNILPGAASKLAGRGTIGSANAVDKANRWRALRANPNFQNQVGFNPAHKISTTGVSRTALNSAFDPQRAQALAQFTSRGVPNISRADRAARWSALGQQSRASAQPWLNSAPAGFNTATATAGRSRIPDLLLGGGALGTIGAGSYYGMNG